MRATQQRRSCRASLGGHADAAVNANGFGVHVAVGDALNDHRGELLWVTEALREEDALLQVLFERFAVFALAVDRACR